MEAINIYDYLQRDNTMINDLIDLDPSSNHDSIFEMELFDNQNEEVLHQYNTATDDYILSDQVRNIYIYIYIYGSSDY